MLRLRLSVAAPVALVAALTTAAVAFGAAGDNDTSYGSKGIAQIPTGNGGTSSGAASVIQDGKLVVAGRATVSTGSGLRQEIAVTRLNADGSRDTTFGTNGETEIAAGSGDSEAFGLAVTPDDKLLVVGSADVSGVTEMAEARLTTGGQPDTTYAPGGLRVVLPGGATSAIAHGVTVGSDGSYVVAATAVHSGANQIYAVKYLASGTLAWQRTTTAGLNTDTRAAGITTLADGSYVVVGQTDALSGTQLLLAHYSVAGALVAGWGNASGIETLDVGDGGAAAGNAITASASRIAVAGSATDENEQKAFVAAFNPATGQPDTAFGTGGVTLSEIGTGGSSEATGVAFDAAGNVVIGGDATTDFQGSPQSQILAARYLPNGALDPSFETASALPGTSLVSGFGLPAFGASVSLQPDGKVVVAGRVGDGDGETLAAARYCASTADQSCTGVGSQGTPPSGGGGGSGSPVPSNAPQPFECGKTVAFGIIEAQGCLQEQNGKFIATGRVDVNGIIMQPEAGATIILDPAALRVYVQGPGGKVGTLSARVGDITIFENLPFDISLPSASVDTFKIPDLAVSARGSLFGFPLTGKADVNLTKGGVSLNVLVGLPSIFGGVTGSVTLEADLVNGLHLDGISITAKDALLGPLEVKDLAISYSDSQKLWSGQATVFLQPFPYGASAAVAVQNGSLKTLSAGVDGLNLPVGEVVFLQRISFGVSTNPLTFMGGIGFTAGPQVAGISAVRIDGNFRLSFPGKPLAKLEIQSGAFCAIDACAVGAGATNGDGLSVVGLPLGGYNFSADTDGNIAFGGHVGIDLALVSLSASVSGWLDGTKAFNLEGSGNACVFSVACAGIDAVISTEGLAACGYVHLATVKVSVGFGIHWPTDISLMGPDCDIGPYRAQHANAARAFAARYDDQGHRLQAAPLQVSFPAGKDYSLVRLTGDSAPPMVTISGDGGASVDTPAAPTTGLKNDRFMVFKDYDKKQTIIVVTKPGTKPWTITPDAGSAAITDVEQADPLPPVSVKAKVTGSAYQRTLTYDVAPIPGQSVKFAEVGGGVTRQLGVTTKAHGSIRFTPGDGNKGKRKIVATVIENGLPRTQLTATTYTAPARRLPTKIKTVTAKRTTAGLAVKWSAAANADTYRVMVSVSDGRVLMFNEPGKTRSLVVTDLLPAESAKVSVRGVTKQLRTGPATPASLKAVPVKKTSKKAASKTTAKKGK